MSNSRKIRVDAFQEVRDLPYFIATRGEQDCCCSTKAYLLEKKLQTLGLTTRHKLCWFKWEKLSLPPEVLQIAHEDLPSHQFLEVLIPETGKWATVDPTWDYQLAAVLPINEWDGISDTSCAVPVEKFCSEADTAKIFKECGDSDAVRAYFESQGAFLRAVNAFLAEARAKYNKQTQPTRSARG